MSTEVAITRYWADWEQVLSGDGVVTIDASGLRSTCSSGATTGRGYMRKYLPARPGEKVTFSFLARRISGEPQASIDYPVAGTSQGVVDIDSDEFQEYELSYIIPYTTNESSDYMQCTVGTFTTPAGACEIVNPRIKVDNASQGFLRAWCVGLIALTRTAGVTTATLNTGFINCGILGVAYSSGTKKLTVTTLKTVNLSLRMKPILSAEFTNDLLPEIVAKAGRYDPVAGDFEVQFSDGTATFVDINALMADGEISYLSVWAMGL